MNRYRVDISSRAARQLRKLSPQAQEALKPAIFGLAHEPRPAGVVKLQGVEAYRIRVGDFRVVYEIHDRILVVLVLYVGHRREVYR